MVDNRISLIDPKLLELLVCPITKASLDYDRVRNELISARYELINAVAEIERLGALR